MEQKYSDAAQKATQAFFIQSGLGPELDSAENQALKMTTQKAYNLIGKEGAVVIGATIYIAKCIRDQKVTTKISNPLLDQKHSLSVGVDGVEISGIRSFNNTSHWVKFDSRQGEGRYTTGINLSF